MPEIWDGHAWISAPPPEGHILEPTALTTLRERLVKIAARIVPHGRSIIFQMAEVMEPRDLFQAILAAIAAVGPLPLVRC